jgi:hypothetical protein
MFQSRDEIRLLRQITDNLHHKRDGKEIVVLGEYGGRVVAVLPADLMRHYLAKSADGDPPTERPRRGIWS